MQGEPDRVETFTAAGGQCTAQWWLDPLVEDVPGEAATAAQQALNEATVSTTEVEKWKDTLLTSGSGEPPPANELEGQAYIEVIRAEVRSGLAEAGYPDAPTRVIETRSDLECP